MPAFKFKLAQCVMVPGLAGVQGRISARTDFIEGENEYRVTWLDEKLALATTIYKESAILAACSMSVVATALSLLVPPDKAGSTPPSFREMRGILKTSKPSRKRSRKAKRGARR
jgi:hypothetical protein